MCVHEVLVDTHLLLTAKCTIHLTCMYYIDTVVVMKIVGVFMKFLQISIPRLTAKCTYI